MRLGIVLAGLSGANVALVFAFQWYVVTTLGAGPRTDALFAGFVVPQFVLAILGGSLSHVLVPLLSSTTGERFQRDAWSFCQGIALVVSPAGLLMFFTTGFWVPWIFPGFDAQTTALTIDIVRIQLLGMLFTALATVLWAVHHARKEFVRVEVAGVLANLAAVGLLVAGLSEYGINTAAWALTLRAALQTVLLAPALGPYQRPDWTGATSREGWRRLWPLLVGASYYRSDQLVDRALSSMAAPGALTLLYLAQQVYSAINLVLSRSIVGPMVPELVQRAQAGEWRAFRRQFMTRFLVVAAITGSGLIVLLLAGRPLIAACFGYANFSTEDTVQLWWLLVALAGVLTGGSLAYVLSASFYAQGDTRTPTKVGIFGFTLGLGFKIIGFLWGGIVGLALGTSLHYLFNVVAMFVLLTRRLEARIGKHASIGPTDRSPGPPKVCP